MPVHVGSSAEQERKGPDEGPDSEALSTEVNKSLTEARLASTVEIAGNTEEVEATVTTTEVQATAAEVVTG